MQGRVPAVEGELDSTPNASAFANIASATVFTHRIAERYRRHNPAAGADADGKSAALNELTFENAAAASVHAARMALQHRQSRPPAVSFSDAATASVYAKRMAHQHRATLHSVRKFQGLVRGRRVRDVMHDAKLKLYNGRGKLMPLQGTRAGAAGWYQFGELCYYYRSMAEEPVKAIPYSSWRKNIDTDLPEM